MRRHPAPFALALAITLVVLLGRGPGARNGGVGVGGRGGVAHDESLVHDDLARYHDRVFTVVNVVDGDTADIDAPDGRYDHTRIRLWGVDTPEVAGSPRGDMYWGAQASAYAKKTLLRQRVRIELVPDETRDKYERLLAYVYLVESGEMFNELLLLDGHAYADTRFKHPHREQFAKLSADAQAAKRGLWANVSKKQMPAWRQKRN